MRGAAVTVHRLSAPKIDFANASFTARSLLKFLCGDTETEH